MNNSDKTFIQTIVHEVGHAVAVKALLGPVILGLELETYSNGGYSGRLKYLNPLRKDVADKTSAWHLAIVSQAGVVAECLFVDFDISRIGDGFSQTDADGFREAFMVMGLPQNREPLIHARAVVAAEKLLTEREQEFQRVLQHVMHHDLRLPTDYLADRQEPSNG